LIRSKPGVKVILVSGVVRHRLDRLPFGSFPGAIDLGNGPGDAEPLPALNPAGPLAGIERS